MHDVENELFERMAKQDNERNQEIRINPLSKYSITELKKEIRRRKG